MLPLLARGAALDGDLGSRLRQETHHLAVDHEASDQVVGAARVGEGRRGIASDGELALFEEVEADEREPAVGSLKA